MDEYISNLARWLSVYITMLSISCTNLKFHVTNNLQSYIPTGIDVYMGELATLDEDGGYYLLLEDISSHDKGYCVCAKFASIVDLENFIINNNIDNLSISILN